MKKPLSIEDLKKSACAKLNPHLFVKEVKRKKIIIRKESKGKISIELVLNHWCKERGLKLVKEYEFHPSRKWRFDFCVPEIRLAVEYEGIYSEKSRHTTRVGYTGDAIKYNTATQLGWKILRYTALNYKELSNDLKEIK